MIVGAFVQAVLHEVALATFDILEMPVWGREADAADKLAGFIMVQFGKDVALKIMIGAAWFFDASDRTWSKSDIASEQSPEAQRFFNYLCIAFGSDPTSFKFLIDQNLLPVRRAQRCTERVLCAAPRLRSADPAACGPATAQAGPVGHLADAGRAQMTGAATMETTPSIRFAE